MVSLKFHKPEVAQYIEDQVASGRFPSEVAVIEAAVEQMMLDEQGAYELSDDEVQAIQEADEAIERGEVVDFETVKAIMREKYGCR